MIRGREKSQDLFGQSVTIVPLRLDPCSYRGCTEHVRKERVHIDNKRIDTVLGKVPYHKSIIVRILSTSLSTLRKVKKSFRKTIT